MEAPNISGLKTIQEGPMVLEARVLPTLPHFSRPFHPALVHQRALVELGWDWRLGGVPGLWPMLPNARVTLTLSLATAPKSRASGVFSRCGTQG